MTVKEMRALLEGQPDERELSIEITSNAEHYIRTDIFLRGATGVVLPLVEAHKVVGSEAICFWPDLTKLMTLS